MNENLPEAGGIAFTTIYSKTGVPINITARSTDTKAAIKDLMDSIVWAMGEYDMTVEKSYPQAPAPKPDPAAQIAVTEGNFTLADDLQKQAAAVPPAPDGRQWNTFGASFVKILPQPDNKVNIEFYGKDRKQPHNDYPELKVNKWDVAQAQGLMKHVTSADVSKAAEFALNCTVYWLEGKEYTSTNGEKRHYKNVSHVR